MFGTGDFWYKNRPLRIVYIMTMNDLRRGERAVVLKVELPVLLKERLRSLGVFTGAKLTVLKVSGRKKIRLIQAGHAKVGNWHGVTVGALEKTAKIGGRDAVLIDLPGIYSLAGMSMEEKFTRDYLAAHERDAVVFVSECAGVERSLPLFLALLKKGRKGILVLTKRRQFERAGGKIDPAALEKRLGAPVLIAERKRRKALKAEFAAAYENISARTAAVSAEELLHGCYRREREGLSRADRLFCNGFFCIPVFLVALFVTFFVTFAPRFPGDLLKSVIEALFSEVFAGYAAKIP